MTRPPFQFSGTSIRNFAPLMSPSSIFGAAFAAQNDSAAQNTNVVNVFIRLPCEYQKYNALEVSLHEELKGKTALVTGASRGIGRATAIGLARAGASRVVIHYGGYREGAEQTRALVEGAGAEAEVLGGDLGAPDGIHQFIADLKRSGPPVDILVNNAGSLVKRAKLAEYTEELFDRVMN